MAACGTNQHTIARALNVTRPTLRKHLREELRHGYEDVAAHIGLALVKAALSGSVRAQIFWLTRHCPKWRLGQYHHDALPAANDDFEAVRIIPADKSGGL
jgi:hypothetical protein